MDTFANRVDAGYLGDFYRSANIHPSLVVDFLEKLAAVLHHVVPLYARAVLTKHFDVDIEPDRIGVSQGRIMIERSRATYSNGVRHDTHAVGIGWGDAIFCRHFAITPEGWYQSTTVTYTNRCMYDHYLLGHASAKLHDAEFYEVEGQVLSKLLQANHERDLRKAFRITGRIRSGSDIWTDVMSAHGKPSLARSIPLVEA